MEEILLTQGKVALVDDEDYDWLMQWKWYAKWNKTVNGYYAVRNKRLPDGRRVSVRMHREIMGAECGFDVDHINHDTLDDRRSNLRVCTHAQNMQNQRLRKDSSSKMQGVQWYKKYSKWVARIGINGRRIFLGYFNDKEEAYAAYCDASKRMHGEFSGVQEGV